MSKLCPHGMVGGCYSTLPRGAKLTLRSVWRQRVMRDPGLLDRIAAAYREGQMEIDYWPSPQTTKPRRVLLTHTTAGALAAALDL